MRFSSTLPTAFALSSIFQLGSTASHDVEPTSPVPGLAHTPVMVKRDLFCSLFGLCTNQYLNDPLNCGTKGNVCKSSLGLGSLGAICLNGVCGGTCGNLFDFNWLTGTCQDVSSDTSNCGACGAVCSLTGASAAKCQSGTCIATKCNSGYTLTAGACAVTINTQTDMKNCGSIGKVCPSSYSNGVGSVCSAGVCQPTSCATGYDWSADTSACIPVLSDVKNCGFCKNSCSFPNGSGSCSNGVCTLSTCATGYYNIAGTCTALNLQTDANNCGAVGKVCSFPNGVGSCKSGTCTLSSCLTGYTLGSNVCTAINTASDVKNCGAVGKICAVPQFSSTAFCTLGVCGANCNAGYAFNSVTGACQLVTSDPLNCGNVGNVCTIANGYGACTAGVCSLGSCKPGFYSVGGQCVVLNLLTDVNNCGAQGFKCPSSYPQGSGVSCVAGLCLTTCLGLFDWNGSSCQDVSTDLKNCGKCGSACTVPNGVGKCSSGVCTVASCYSGYLNINGACTYYNLQSDVNNCGSVGNKCAFTNGLGSCSAGVCTYSSCTSPYVLTNNVCTKVDLTSDVNHCGSTTTVCPSSYVNGGAAFCSTSVCQTKCNTGYDFDFTYSYCRPVYTDINNCGRCGSVCSLTGATATTCLGGQCLATTCGTGYTLVSGVCTIIDTTSDAKNCGKLGNVCTFSPSTATGACVASVCTIQSCGTTAYTLQKGVCVKTTASQRARLAKKDSGIDKRTLCPTGETACPIVGSASYDMAVSQHFSAMSDFSSVISSGSGFECLDTTQSLESCGGCASTGEGQDCSKIRGAVGVGCDSGACVVFSCLAGWRPNLSGTRCVRAHVDSTHAAARNGTRSTSAPRRHLHARHSSHHHG